MTVGKLMQLLSEMPADSEVTDICGSPIVRACFEPDESNPEEGVVWLDTEHYLMRR